MKYKILLTYTAQEHLKEWRKTGQVKTLKKISSLFKELQEHPHEGTGNVEKLKGNLSGLWSRRIDKKNRLIYSIKDELIVVVVIFGARTLQ